MEVLDQSDVRAALEMKLDEEVAELLAATGDDRLQEIADVHEAILALAREIGSTEEDLLHAVSSKRKDRGAFSDNLWLVDAG